jgi:hypothetical protein
LAVSSNPSPQELEEAVRRWRTAEQRLYPMAMASPEGYERYVALVRAVADDLRPVRNAEALTDAYAGAVDIAVAAARRHGLPTEGLELELAAGAAFSLRYREVLAEERREEAARRVGEARARRQEWVTIHETGVWRESPVPPYARVELHLPEGTGLHLWVEESLERAGVEYGVEVVQLDPQTGQWLTGRPISDRRTFSEYGAWKEAVRELRARCDKPDNLDVDEEGADDVASDTNIS